MAFIPTVLTSTASSLPFSAHHLWATAIGATNISSATVMYYPSYIDESSFGVKEEKKEHSHLKEWLQNHRPKK